jgi:beta-galactosidase
VLDGQWCAFDYARGYHPERAACGVMDIFRLPKFSYYFYRSQRGPSEGGPDWTGGPMVFIASHWTPASDLRVLVYSNCEEVSLRLDGRLLERKAPSSTWMSQYLPHPPFVFDLPRFTAGTLEATGYVGAQAVVNHRVSTPGAAVSLEIVVDDLGISPGSDEADVVIAHGRIRDAQGELCIAETGTMKFSLEGAGELAGPTRIEAEAGIASTVLRLAPAAVARGFTLRASYGALAAEKKVVVPLERRGPVPDDLQPV